MTENNEELELPSNPTLEEKLEYINRKAMLELVAKYVKGGQTARAQYLGNRYILEYGVDPLIICAMGGIDEAIAAARYNYSPLRAILGGNLDERISAWPGVPSNDPTLDMILGASSKPGLDFTVYDDGKIEINAIDGDIIGIPHLPEEDEEPLEATVAKVLETRRGNREKLAAVRKKFSAILAELPEQVNSEDLSFILEELEEWSDLRKAANEKLLGECDD